MKKVEENKKYVAPKLTKNEPLASSTFGLQANGSCSMCQLTNYH